jgi:hypothetical protein
MSNAFLSYSRFDAPVATEVVDDLQKLRYATWYDRQIAGGQAWWKAILRQIRECDIFIAILTPRWQESQACRAETSYAAQLNKRILPVLCDDRVKVNQLPPELEKVQYVDYRAQNRQAGIAMAIALRDLPEAVPLPDPLPPEPPVPISYLGDLRAQIETDRELSGTEQRDVLFEVKRRLKDPESHDDALALLRRMLGREDLRASFAEEIKAILDRDSRGTASAAEESKAILDRGSRGTRQEPSQQNAPAEKNIVADPPPATMDLTGDSKGIEGLVRNVVANSESWVLKAGEDSLCISLEKGEIVLAASFSRWTEKDMKSLNALGWSTGGQALKNAAAIALGVVGAATYGLGLLGLMHKGTRDLLKSHLALKRFSPSQEREAAADVLAALRVLRPGTTTVVVSRVQVPTPEQLGECFDDVFSR